MIYARQLRWLYLLRGEVDSDLAVMEQMQKCGYLSSCLTGG